MLSIFRSRLHSVHGIVASVIFITGAIVFPASAQDTKAEEAYQGASKLFDIKLWEDAARAYRNYIKEYPKHAKAGLGHYGLGMCYFNMKQYAPAAREFKFAAGNKGLDKVNVEANLYLGQSLMLKTPAAPKDAKDAFEAGLKSIGFAKKGFINRVWDGESVTQWLKKVEDKKKRQLAEEVFIGLLEATYMQGNWKSVVAKVTAFEGLIKGSGVEQRVRVLTGEAQSKSKNYKEAAVAYEAATNLEGTDASEALFRLGMIRLDHLQVFEAAAKDFQKFSGKYKSDSQRPNATFNEALCYYKSYYAGQESHLAKAVELFSDFARSNPKHELADTAQFYVGKLEHIRGNWTATVKALESLMDSENPAFEQLVFLVADSHHRLENWDKSAKFYMQFAEVNEKALNADVALHNAGFAYSNLKKPDIEKAMAAYDLLGEKCPRSPHLPSACLNLGIIHWKAGRYDEARKSLQKIPSNHMLWPDAEYHLALTDLDSSKPIDAAKRFWNLSKSLTRTAPKHRLIAMSKLLQGAAELDARRFKESIKTYTDFIGGFPGHKFIDEAAFNRGLGQMELRQWDEAIKSFEIVPEKSELHADSLYKAAWSERSAGKPKEAIPYYENILEKYANIPLADNVALELAEVEFETGGEEAGANSVKLLTALLNKKSAPDARLRRLAFYSLGLVQFKQKNYPESAKAFEDLLDAGAKNLLIQAAYQAGEARRQVARTAQKADQERGYKAALKNFEIAVLADKPDPGTEDAKLREQSLLSVAQCKAQLELWADSQKSFELFIESNPKHFLIPSAHLGLGWALQNQDKYPGAIKSFEKTVAAGVRDDTGARAQFLLGECYLEQKQYDKAIIELAKAEALYKFPHWQSKAAYEMAQALLQKENRDGARQQFERLIKRYPNTQAATAAKSELKRLN